MDYRGHQINNHIIKCKLNMEDRYVNRQFYAYGVMIKESAKTVKFSNMILSVFMF